MKKIIILIILTIFLTGCHISVNFTSNNEEVDNTSQEYLNLTCQKRKSKDNYLLNETIKFYCVKNADVFEVKQVIIESLYINKKTNEIIENPTEVEKYLQNFDENDISIEKLDNNEGYRFVIDFEKNPELINKLEYKEFAYDCAKQTNQMPQLGYLCHGNKNS